MRGISAQVSQNISESSRKKPLPALTSGPLSYCRAYADAMELYRPSRIRLLFIAEAPPAYRFHRLFYFPDVRQMDTLFLEMMKTLYPVEVGYHNGQFLPGHSAAAIRRRKLEFLARFQADGFYLTDAHELPVPDAASSSEKAGLLLGSLSHLSAKIQALSGQHSPPIVLIGKVTYKVCAGALRNAGFLVLNSAAIDHPARGGQRRFRASLAQAVSVLSPDGS
jgi:hypothetical protein